LSCTKQDISVFPSFLAALAMFLEKLVQDRDDSSRVMIFPPDIASSIMAISRIGKEG
jgi:hypothetical protein